MICAPAQCSLPRFFSTLALRFCAVGRSAKSEEASASSASMLATPLTVILYYSGTTLENTVEPPITDPSRSGQPPYSGHYPIEITIVVILKQPPRTGRFSIGQRTKSALPTALCNAELPLKSGPQKTTPSRTSDNGPSEKRTTSLQRTLYEYPCYGLNYHGCVLHTTSEKRMLLDSGQRTKSALPTALCNASLNSGHQETTPLKLYLHEHARAHTALPSLAEPRLLTETPKLQGGYSCCGRGFSGT